MLDEHRDRAPIAQLAQADEMARQSSTSPSQ
jgi:hypothetical protein